MTPLNHLAVSYNQPKLCTNASWDPHATTFTDTSLVGSEPRGLFIDRKNIVYISDRKSGQILVWSEGNNTPIAKIPTYLVEPYSLFVTTTGDIFVDGLNTTNVVNKYNLNLTSGIPVMYTCGKCYDVFVDIKDILYCALRYSHQVISKSLKADTNAWTVVAGTGNNGSESNMLNQPRGVFVDTNFELYVADHMNDRIQRFRPGEINGTTIVGNKSFNTTFTLKQPTAVVLDADKYLFIVDWLNHRIIGSDENGFRCLVGCSDDTSSKLNQLNYPIFLRFDSYGNIFVSDRENNRIQKFSLLNDSCSKFNNKSQIS